MHCAEVMPRGSANIVAKFLIIFVNHGEKSENNALETGSARAEFVARVNVNCVAHFLLTHHIPKAGELCHQN